MARSSSHRRWTPVDIIGAVILASLGLAVTFDAWVAICRTAGRDPDSRYIFLVPFVAAWLVWVRRGRFRQCVTRGRLVGCLLVIAGWFVFFTGERFLVEPLWHAGALVLVTGCLLSVLGTDALLRFLPAFLVSGLLIPFPAVIRLQVAPPLASATAQATQGAMELLGSSIHRSAGLLTVNGVHISVAVDCCGLGFLFTLILVSAAAVFGAPLRNNVRFLVLVATPVVAFFFNVARVVLAVWLFSSQPRIVAEQFHDMSSVLALPAAFLLLMGLIVLLRWAFIPVNSYTLARTD